MASSQRGNMKSDYASVTTQTGLYAGDAGVDVSVEHATTLTGAVIDSTASPNTNRVTTGSLTMNDIQNEASYQSTGSGISYGIGKDVAYNKTGLVPMTTIRANGNSNNVTTSAIAEGHLTVRNGSFDAAVANRNTRDAWTRLQPIFDKQSIEERQALAQLFAKNAFEQVHNWKPTTTEDKAAKSVVHGLISEMASRLAGNGAGSGFYAGFTNEMLIDEIANIANKNPAAMQWMSTALGEATNKVLGYGAVVGGGTAESGTRDNYGAALMEEAGVEAAVKGVAMGAAAWATVEAAGNEVYEATKEGMSTLVTAGKEWLGYGTGAEVSTSSGEGAMITYYPGSDTFSYGYRNPYSSIPWGDTSLSFTTGSGYAASASGITPAAIPWQPPMVDATTHRQYDWDTASASYVATNHYIFDKNVYDDLGGVDEFNRYYITGVSIASNRYTDTVKGPDGAYDWRIVPYEKGDTFVHIKKADGTVATMPYTYGDTMVVDHPNVSIIENVSTGTFVTVDGYPVSKAYVEKYKDRISAASNIDYSRWDTLTWSADGVHTDFVPVVKDMTSLDIKKDIGSPQNGQPTLMPPPPPMDEDTRKRMGNAIYLVNKEKGVLPKIVGKEMENIGLMPIGTAFGSKAVTGYKLIDISNKVSENHRYFPNTLDALKADAYDVAPVVAGYIGGKIVTGVVIGVGSLGGAGGIAIAEGVAPVINHSTSLVIEVGVEKYTSQQKEELRSQKNKRENQNMGEK